MTEELLWRMTEAEAAYIAGLIDGEGTIALHVDSRGSYGGSRMRLMPSITIVSIDSSIITWLKEVTRCGYISHRSFSDRRRDQWTFNVNAVDELRRILVCVLPHLRIKKKHGELLLIYCSERIKGKPFTDVEKEIYYDLKELNIRGKSS